MSVRKTHKNPYIKKCSSSFLPRNKQCHKYFENYGMHRQFIIIL